MDTSIGKIIEGELCDNCKDRIRRMTEDIKKKPYLIAAPKRLAKKFFKCLCKECKNKCVTKVQGVNSEKSRNS